MNGYPSNRHDDARNLRHVVRFHFGVGLFLTAVVALDLRPPSPRPSAQLDQSAVSEASAFQLRATQLRDLGFAAPDVVVGRVTQQLRVHAGKKAGRASACKDMGRKGRKSIRGGAAQGELDCEMERHFLRNKTVTCNDGSRSGYYLRKSRRASKKWIVFLEGGWFCFDKKSCQGRSVNTPNLMSSTYWPITKKGHGILSWDIKENPFLYDSNLVSIPYCSSDAWSGRYKSNRKDEFSFMGAFIIEEVLKELLLLHGLATASKLYLAGASAGGTGVLLNIDSVAALISNRTSGKVKVRGIADSGWFIDNAQYRPVECTDSHSCSPVESVQRGIQLWNGFIPDSCRQRNRVEPWRCYFGYVVYATITTPVFIIQHLFDEGQLIADNVGPPMHRAQWQYIHNVGVDIRRTLVNVTSVFAPACLSHILMTRRDWWKVEIDGISLGQSLDSWQETVDNEIHPKKQKKRTNLKSQRSRHNNDLLTGVSRSEHPNTTTRLAHARREGKRARRLRLHNELITNDNRLRRQKKNQSESDVNIFETNSYRKNNLRHRRSASAADNYKQSENVFRQQNASTLLKENAENEIYFNRTADYRNDFYILGIETVGHADRISSRENIFRKRGVRLKRSASASSQRRLVDGCAWPQCNPSCPRLRNPFNGQEMDFFDLFTQFGLNITDLAKRSNVDVASLQSLDHGQLLQLLINSST